MLSQIQRIDGESQLAEATLIDALNRYPTDEDLYTALLALYAPADGSPSPITDAARKMAQLQARLFRILPDSRLANLLRARDLASRGQFERSQAILLTLLKSNHDDPDASSLLLELYLRFNRAEEAKALFENMYERNPNSLRVLALGISLYEQLKDEQRYFELSEAYLLSQPPDERRNLALAHLYLSVEQFQQAADVLDQVMAQEKIEQPMVMMEMIGNALNGLDDADGLNQRFEQAIKQFPDRGSDLAYALAQYHFVRGDEAAYETAMLKGLEKFPDHPGMNNDLGYRWTVQHKNLAQAKAMIQKAVDTEPNVGPYLDSMGWVEYKLGNFNEAIKWLQRATAAEQGSHPVIYDHLGDALYRNGDVAEAIKQWQQAQRLFKQMNQDRLDDETKVLLELLPEKIKAAKKGDPVNVAELPKTINKAPPPNEG